MYLANLYFTNLYLINLRRIQNHELDPNNFNIRLILKFKQHSYLKELKRIFIPI